MRRNRAMQDINWQVRLQKFFPSVRPYESVHRNLYVTHQKLAKTFSPATQHM
jgi:hypothetical protein